MMRAHAALGNRVAVKDQFDQLTEILKRELGVGPNPETRRLYQQLVK
jgi:DNA-binding SARP family transcriptional activator